jgi:hypothetical protein
MYMTDDFCMPSCVGVGRYVDLFDRRTEPLADRPKKQSKATQRNATQRKKTHRNHSRERQASFASLLIVSIPFLCLPLSSFSSPLSLL